MNTRPTQLTVASKEFGNQIHVSCGIIQRDSFVLAVQRSRQMSLPLKWEFPGGKIEKDETPKQCLKRELMEELNVNVQVGHAMKSMTHAYEMFKVTLYPFVCSIVSGQMHLHEHAAFLWVPLSKLHALDWAEADVPVLEAYLKMPWLQKGEPF